MAKKFKGEDGKVYVQRKPFYQKWWFILLVLAGIGGAFGGNKSSQKTSSSSETTQSVETPTSQETTTTSENSSEKTEQTVTKKAEPSYTIGQLVKVGDVEYTVLGKELATNIGGEYGKNANGVFVLVTVTVTNKGNKPITVTDDFFTLIKGETEYTSDSSAGIYANDDAKFFLTELNPENTVTGLVVFDVNEATANDPGLQLRVQTGFWGTQKGLISLQ